MKDSLDILNRMNPAQKVNYDKVFQKVKENWQEENIRPKILLHSCCAPCSTYALEYLTQYAEVTIYFANSNIHPASEYERRKFVQAQFISEFNQKTNQNVQFIAAPYTPNLFVKMVRENHFENEKEGGKRCASCFQMRLDLVAQKAKALDFDYFGSALTISPMKNSQLINEIGLDIQKIYNVHYLPSDFKKNNGYKRSVEMCKDYAIYRQCYCGCIYAAKQQSIDLKAQNRDAIAFLKSSK
ncbi:DNA integration/recombination/inversion protein [Lactococcus hircilactis]|uniref:Epoxyqueuosine reductase QueH n=1 Tax=Lactococcus hircilactis TaxID=1494462 RepID=A0A7X1ZAF9_9LACT|nr:epoxyqueuosine reductase QueH [Lactococcus hircilactis]MQW39662.1 DNA integration/recombination/inversion protein [Lactococcus hircilactis]